MYNDAIISPDEARRWKVYRKLRLKFSTGKCRISVIGNAGTPKRKRGYCRVEFRK